MSRASFAAFGVPFRVECPDADVFSRLQVTLPPGSQPSVPASLGRAYSIVREAAAPHGADGFRMVIDEEIAASAEALPEVLELFEGDLQLHVAEHATPWIFLHAGVVGWKGAAIVLPGRSFAGKSTLVSALLRSGATYFSDEYAVLDAGGNVHPYPRALSLRGPGLLPWRGGPCDFGAVAAQGPAPVGLVGLFSYQPSPTAGIVRLSSARAILELLLHAVPVRRRPRDVVEVLACLVSKVPVLYGDRGEAEPCAAWTLAQLEAQLQTP